MKNIISDSFCLEGKCPEASAKSLSDAFGTKKKQPYLSFAILESATVIDASMLLCKACYSLEGDSPLILSAYRVFDQVELRLESTTNFQKVSKVISHVSFLLNTVHDKLTHTKMNKTP